MTDLILIPQPQPQPQPQLDSSNELLALRNFVESVVLQGIPNIGTRRIYGVSLMRFLAWYAPYNAQGRGKFDRTAVLTHLAAPEVQKLSGSSRNTAIAAIKKLARELQYKKMISFEDWHGIDDIKAAKPHSSKAPNWLTKTQLQDMMNLPANTMHGARDRALLSIVAGCGLRRAEICKLKVNSIEQRSGRWIFVVRGKGQGGPKLRLVPIPNGVKVAIDVWLEFRSRSYLDGKIPSDSFLLIPVLQGESLKERSLHEHTIYDIVKQYGDLIGLPRLAPHDLRRTYAKLTREQGADLDQIQFTMGHEDIKTTQKYIGDSQNLTNAPGDLLTTNWMGDK